MTFDYTICIPVFTQPHFLSITLDGLVKHSRLNARILVVDSEQEDIRPQDTPRPDFYRHPDSHQEYYEYRDVKQFFDVHVDWLAAHHVEYFNVTNPFQQWWQQKKAGLLGGSTTFQGGMDIAFKNNWILPFVETEWVIPNWDADFYPMPDWDIRLFELTQTELCTNRTALIPTHVQPSAMNTLPGWTDIWVESREIASPRLCLPTLSPDCAFTDDELVEFYQAHKRDHLILSEIAGRRERLHWVPMAFRTEELREIIGPWNYQGGGYDIEFDNRCGKLGIRKLSHGASWIYHKACILSYPGELHQE
jgi:hypothetical protein